MGGGSGREREAEEALREARRTLSERPGGRGEEWGEAEGSLMEDVEALRMVLKSISEFVRDLGEPLERLVDVVLKGLDGEKLGRDVAEFYRRLREAGVPEDVAAEMTREYFRARLKAFDVSALIGSIRGSGRGGEEEG